MAGPAGHSSPLSEPTPVPWPWALGRGPVKVCRSQGPAERAAPRELRGHPSLGLCLGCECLGTGPGLCSVRWGQSVSRPSRVPSLSPSACIVAFLAPLRRALAWHALHARTPPPRLAPAGVYVCERLLPGPSARPGARSTSTSFASLQFSLRHRSRPTYLGLEAG